MTVFAWAYGTISPKGINKDSKQNKLIGYIHVFNKTAIYKWSVDFAVIKYWILNDMPESSWWIFLFKLQKCLKFIKYWLDSFHFLISFLLINDLWLIRESCWLILGFTAHTSNWVIDLVKVRGIDQRLDQLGLLLSIHRNKNCGICRFHRNQPGFLFWSDFWWNFLLFSRIS